MKNGPATDKLIEKCAECDCGGKRLIVNKHFFLCDEKNYARLHQGRTRMQVHQQRAKASLSGQRIRLERTLHGSKPKRSKRIKGVSDAKRYRCSDGTLVSQSEINERLKVAYKSIDQARDPICQGTGRSDLPLSHSHTISQARCKELGKTELIWDEDNIELENFHEPSSFPTAAHNIWEVGSLEQKKTLLNFTRKLQYIELHDQQTFQKLTWST